MKNIVTIATAVNGLVLKELNVVNAKEYYNLVEKNRAHLTRHGDYSEYKDMTYDEIITKLNDRDDNNLKFGIWLNSDLIGRADLSPRKPGNYVLGYWLSEKYAGNGYATAASIALIDYGRTELGAKAIFAGVTKGNKKSEALLKRLGFEENKDKDTHTVFKLKLLANM